jgi:hypothetical protein
MLLFMLICCFSSSNVDKKSSLSWNQRKILPTGSLHQWQGYKTFSQSAIKVSAK